MKTVGIVFVSHKWIMLIANVMNLACLNSPVAQTGDHGAISVSKVMGSIPTHDLFKCIP